MIKRWALKPMPEPEQVQELSRQININEVLASILLQRNIFDYDQAKAFFRPALSQLHDPFLMKDMDKAVERLEKAMENGEKILVYGDYDVDGTTAVSVFYGFLRKIYPKLDFYIPDRYTEGYGISTKGIDWAEENGFGLIVSLDCGIKAVDKVAYASEKGIDFIICDHHRPGVDLPAAYAVLDPKREDCHYPYDELSGCGVGFKLLQAYCIKNEIEPALLFEFLDLLAVSIASDIVPLTGENRVLAYYGIKKLTESPRPGLKALLELAALRSEVSVTNIVFGIGPRINAAGRIGHASMAVKLLLSESQEEAEAFAVLLNDNNILRKSFDANITKEALEMIEGYNLETASKSNVLFKHDWHKGVIGIVASRCIEKYYKPTIILTESNNKAAGSARSVFGFDVYEAIAECSDLLDQYGGHMYAAGLTLPLDKVEAFREKFEKVVANKITEEQQVPHLEIDLALDFNKISFKFFNILKQMEPFGPFHMHPVFMTENVYVKGTPRLIKNDHVKFHAQQKGNIYAYDTIGFGFGSFVEQLSSGKPFRMAYTIEENCYMNTRSLQLCLKDLKFED